TAAEYVFLLDPWWNPAVEAQAIDRAHRIGQSRHVFAYRLIAADTVEEKIAELQQSKRALADAILRADVGLLQSLQKEDIELLLSRSARPRPTASSCGGPRRTPADRTSAAEIPRTPHPRRRRRSPRSNR